MSCTSVYAQNSSLEADVVQCRAEVSTKDKELQDTLAELVSAWLDNHGLGGRHAGSHTGMQFATSRPHLSWHAFN